MKRKYNISQFLCALIAGIFMVLQLNAQNLPAKPNPPKLVNDFAGILNSSQISQLEIKLVALDDSTSNQIAVVTIKSLDGYDISDYANKLFRSWGIGNKKTNNGVLLLVAVEDRKVWIATGYGLEGAIPDITASDIIAKQITPNFKAGDYFAGIDSGTDALAAAAAGEYHTARERNDDSDIGSSGIFIFIVIVVIIILIIRRGGGGGGMMSRRGSGTWFPPIWFGGGGGSSFGGGFGGGDSGGGFGGFGGGSSGGGGAGGSW